MKKSSYVFLWVLVGLLASFVVHSVVEIGEIKYAYSIGVSLNNITFFGFGFGYCALPVGAQITILVLGLAGGFWAGLYFWERVYGKNKKKKKNRK